MLAWVAQLSRKKIALIWALIFLAGLVSGVWAWVDSRQGLETRLMEDTRRAAAAIASDETRSLSGTRADLGRRDYALVKQRLALLQAASPNARMLSIVRFVPETGRAILLADSVPGSNGLAPGDDFGDAPLQPVLQRVYSTDQLAVAGPFSDPSGTWAMGFAPVIQVSASGAVSASILDLDVSAGEWAGSEWAAGIQAALCLWILFGLPFSTLLVMRAQREQRKAFRNVLGAIEQSQSAVMIVDLESSIEYVNASLCAQMGYSRRELLGRPWRDFQQPETPAERLAEMVATVRSGNSWRGEWFNRRRNGEIYPVRGVVSPVKNRDGSLACFVTVFEDMTELKRSESALRAALSRAEAGDRAKSQFLATMSHEVRTPLNGIIGFTSLLLGMPRTPEQDEYIQIIRSNGEALIQLTGDILDFAQIESGNLKLDPKPCDPRCCVETTLDMLAVQAAAKKVELLHWVDDNVPASIVADEPRLRQVLVNLVGNAVKFTERGEVEVTVRAAKAPDAAPAEWILTFSVRDTGIGIAVGDQDRLFKPFNQVDVTSTRRYGGTGLGLAISKNLVEIMGGSISVNSDIGSGSTFSFALPVAAAPAPKVPTPQITGMRLALAALPGPFRTEFGRLARRWGARLVEVDDIAGLNGCERDVAFIEIDDERLRHITAGPATAGEQGPIREAEKALPWPPDKTYAIVPMSLSRELRSALRGHFRQVINKPLHHEATLEMLAGNRPSATFEERPERFELNVLVAEDNAINQRLVQKMLWSLGCTSAVMENGRAAVDELARSAEQYDVVLMDLHMPVLDGLDAIEKIRAGEAGEHSRKIWIAALTADARTEQRERVLAAGANDYVVKPIKLGELANTLRRYLAQKKA